VDIPGGLHSKSSCFLYDLGLAVLTSPVVFVCCTPPFDICGIWVSAQTFHSGTTTSASACTVPRKSVLHCERAPRLVSIIVAASSTCVITPYEAGFNTVQEWFEIEVTSREYTQALDYLGTDGNRPSIEGRICRICHVFPKHELTHTSCDDPTIISALGRWPGTHD